MSVSSRVQADFTGFVQECFCRELMGFLMNFLSRQPSDENGNTVPYDLKDFSWRNLGDIYLKISISIISCPSIESSDNGNCIHSCEIGQSRIVDCTQHVDLRPPDVSLLLVMHSILVEPVVKGDFEIDVISEVSWPRGCYKELRLVWDQMIIVEFFGSALVVLSNQSKTKVVDYIRLKILLMSWEAVLILDRNIN